MHSTTTTDAMIAAPAGTTGSCLLCGGRKIHYCFSIDGFRVEACAACSLMRLNPQPGDETLASLHQGARALEADAELAQHAAELRAATAEHYLDLLARYLRAPLTGRMLAIGSDLEEFIACAKARGLQVEALACTPATAAGLADAGLAALQAAETRFDIVVFASMLEHVRDPRPFLHAVHTLLNDDGVLMSIVPALDSVPARLIKSKWRGFAPQNLWYYSRSTLRRLLHGESFGTVQMEFARKSVSLDFARQYFELYPSRRFALLVSFLRRVLPRALRRRPVGIQASEVVAFARRQTPRARKVLSIVLPAFNEEKTIAGAIDRVLDKQLDSVDIEVIIVESNSTDGTREVIRGYETHPRVKVIWQERPRGKGNAVREGLAQVRGDFVLIQDADDEYDIEDYDALIEPLLTGEETFVLGARHGGRAWKLRQFDDQRMAGHALNFGHWFFATLVNVVYGLRLKDPFTMYKVFRADCLRGLLFECNRFDFDYELLIKLVRSGYQPIEIPVNYRSRSFKEGKKVNVLRDPWTWLAAIFKFRFVKM